MMPTGQLFRRGQQLCRPPYTNLASSRRSSKRSARRLRASRKATKK
ncbi:hypothetical protein FOIG_16766 [Fusarium odoratissimum NRRL 54006]|uniref:Uncharacterized protein n=1 Tax=Fusarium odoratissimum (strain NRRL 54006) TaxID=1089451 RepID=X0J130_FUSO5|nr:uncharacterized protein FOIG_16766 [Fusarium odoratissimum NRRL 54006]EXL89955.1 hypothetical protein FOIG_16766 [Fusarium odoratissimum NRRL 54006]